MRVSKLAKVASVALAFGLVTTTPAYAANLEGSGASFPALLIEACKAPFANESGHTYTYSAVGSGAGRTNSDRAVGDFWMTDAPHTGSSRRASIIHIPVVAAPIGILHNLPIPSSKKLQLSASTIAGIFSGKITMWNDPAIVADNNRTVTSVVYFKNADGSLKKDKNGDPMVQRTRNLKSVVALPNKKINVIYRSDSSGTTENFTDFLNKSAPTIWTKTKKSVFKDSFPGNINDISNLGRITAAAQSSGVALTAGKTPYSITYAEVSYAKANKLQAANIINNAGASVAPDSTGVSAFLAQATQDSSGYLTFDFATKEQGAYPLGITSYLLADTKYPNKATAAAVAELAKFWLSPKCAKDAGESLGFTVIDGDFLKKSLAQIAKIG
jgi:phosphate transport system substrate-binding protein